MNTYSSSSVVNRFSMVPSSQGSSLWMESNNNPNQHIINDPISQNVYKVAEGLLFANTSEEENRLRPYLKDLRRHESGIDRPNAFFEFIRLRIWHSLFLTKGWELFIIYAIQVLIILFLHFEIIPASIFPIDTLLFNGFLFVFLSFLLAIVVSNVAGTRFDGSLQEFYVSLLGNTADTVQNLWAAMGDDALKIEVDTEIYNGDDPRDRKKIRIRKINGWEMARDLRHIIIAHLYALSKNFSSTVDIIPDKLPMPFYLINELKHISPTGEDYMDALRNMYTKRIDVLQRKQLLVGGAVVNLYAKSDAFGGNGGTLTYLTSRSNVPTTVTDALTIMIWGYLFYLPFALFSFWGLVGTLIVVWVANFILHGMIAWASVYNNIFDLELKNRLIGHDFRITAHETARNVDEKFAHFDVTMRFAQDE